MNELLQHAPAEMNWRSYFEEKYDGKVAENRFLVRFPSSLGLDGIPFADYNIMSCSWPNLTSLGGDTSSNYISINCRIDRDNAWILSHKLITGLNDNDGSTSFSLEIELLDRTGVVIHKRVYNIDKFISLAPVLNYSNGNNLGEYCLLLHYINGEEPF